VILYLTEFTNLPIYQPSTFNLQPSTFNLQPSTFNEEIMSLYLALKEIWRNRGRFLLFSLVIALITTLVLFIAALAGGLATANRQFIDKLDADLLVYQENTDLQVTSSRLGLSKTRQVRRVDGVADVGALGFSSGTAVFADGREPVDISLVGVEPGKPGDPALLSGEGLRNRRGKDVVIDQGLARKADLGVGDELVIKTIQGTDEEFYKMEIVGITGERQYFFQPSVLMPIQTWDEIRPQAIVGAGNGEVIANLIAVRLEDPAQADAVAQSISRRVDGIEVTDKETAIQALPGYSAQQNTLNTQQFFTLFIGVLVVGGFFQIQTLQKVGQIGMLKAIGSSNRNVAIAALLQIIAVTVIGVGIGSAGTLLLSLGLPGDIPIIFSSTSVIGAIAALLLIGPLGGLVSIRLAVKIEPLTAIGLSS
jgi:putative ABC transport system permease protein